MCKDIIVDLNLQWHVIGEKRTLIITSWIISNIPCELKVQRHYRLFELSMTLPVMRKETLLYWQLLVASMTLYQWKKTFNLSEWRDITQSCGVESIWCSLKYQEICFLKYLGQLNKQWNIFFYKIYIFENTLKLC